MNGSSILDLVVEIQDSMRGVFFPSESLLPCFSFHDGGFFLLNIMKSL